MPATPTQATTALIGADSGAFLGDNLLLWLMLALGGALFIGNVLAVVRPPSRPRDAGDLHRAPRTRSLTMAAIGLVVALAALATLVVRSR